MKRLSGWWRLWIALSVIWAVIVFFVFFSSSKPRSASDRARIAISFSCSGDLLGSQVDWTRVPPETIEAAIAAATTGKVPDPPTHATPTPIEKGWGPSVHTEPDSVELLLTAKSAESEGEAKKFVTSCLDAKLHDYEQDVARERHTDLLWCLVAAVVPPVLLLLLAALVFWVIAGFRNARPPS